MKYIVHIIVEEFEYSRSIISMPSDIHYATALSDLLNSSFLMEKENLIIIMTERRIMKLTIWKINLIFIIKNK